MPNRKENYRNMELFRKTRNAQRQRYYDKTSKYKPRAWNKEEDEAVLSHDITDTELSEKISRSVASIQIRRSRLKKIGNK